MTEQEVLDKLVAYKDAILKLKEDRDHWKRSVIAKMVEIDGLKKQLEELQQQSQQSKTKDDEAKSAFMQELGRVLKDAEDVLQDA